jgi:PAS domain S-box-containing protein
MPTNSEETEIEQLREEIRHLRGLLTEKETSDQLLSASQRRVAEQADELASTREELTQQVQLFDTVLSSIVDFAYTFNREGRFTYVNQALLDLWQKKLEDARGKNFFELDYPEDVAARLQEQIKMVFRTGQALKDETAYTGATGTAGYYEYIFVPVFGKDGQVEIVAGSTRDITIRQQEKAEREALFKILEIERARLTSLFVQAPAFITVLRGPTHILEMANPHYLQLVGHRDLLGKPVREAFPEIEGQGYFEFLDEVYRSGKPFIGKEMRILFQEEANTPLRERVIDFVYQPLVEADGAVSGIFVHGVDLTERKRAEQALEERTHEIETLNHRLTRAMRETHHRVKNNLQVIAALVDMQVMNDTDTIPVSELQRFGRHIRALSTIHDLLTQDAKGAGELNYISLQAMLDSLLPLLKEIVGQRELQYDVADVRLPVRYGTALALMTNELVSNAVKHGAGLVEVMLSAEGNLVRLEVRDRGLGFPEEFDARRSAHTGLDLIDGIARLDLRGEVAYETRSEGGASVAITFPLPAGREKSL